MSVLLVGAAGYVGSHVNKYLYQNNIATVVLDNLEKTSKEAVQWGEFVLGDIRNPDHLNLVFETHPQIDTVIHFAAYLSVPESVTEPEKYYENNVTGTLNLLKAMRVHNVRKLIFSSSCTIYGNTDTLPVSESVPFQALSPYGRSKVMIEQILSDYSHAYDLRYVSLRYFNPVGADPESQIGFTQNPATQLVPILLETAYGKRQKVDVFGDDYDTKDGSPVRDYVHIMDVASAHYHAYRYLHNKGKSDVFNLGSEQGYTVREVIEMVRQVTGKDFKVEQGPRRAGDVEKIYADSTKAKKILKWKPRYGLEAMIRDANAWYQRYFLK